MKHQVERWAAVKDGRLKCSVFADSRRDALFELMEKASSIYIPSGVGYWEKLFDTRKRLTGIGRRVWAAMRKHGWRVVRVTVSWEE